MRALSNPVLRLTLAVVLCGSGLAAIAVFLFARSSGPGAVEPISTVGVMDVESISSERIDQSPRSSVRETPGEPEPEPLASAGIFTREVSGDSPDDRITEEGLIVDGKREGKWRVSFADGTLWLENHYENGLLDGHFVTHDHHGRVRSDDLYRTGKLHGRSIGWHSNGRIAYEFTFADGLREGAWTEWRDDGRIKALGESRNDKFDGKCVWYLPDGSVDPKLSGLYSGGKRVTELP
jgi:hypothetical protein